MVNPKLEVLLNWILPVGHMVVLEVVNDAVGTWPTLINHAADGWGVEHGFWVITEGWKTL